MSKKTYIRKKKKLSVAEMYKQIKKINKKNKRIRVLRNIY